jgi:serine/threonine protein kinase
LKTVLSADSASLLPGTQVGSWRVVSQHGDGSYGVVYRVVRVGQEDAGPFALKVAKHPLDPRFEREWELLSLIRHPQVPSFEARGWVTFPGGVSFPYVVMEWVEGIPLYEWAAREPRTSRQVLRVLAQVARALEATHAVEGVHRDVKGDNVRVRAGDGTAVLMDFGSGYFRGAPVLTRQPPPPGTERYWSPECLRFQMKWLRHPTMRYEAGPADDLYALGVMAYRLVTGEYPPPWTDFIETEEGLQLVPPEPVPVETRATVSPELAALINKLLSDEPAARGSAAEVAEALEQAANASGGKVDQLITPVSAQAPTVSESPAPVQAPRSTPRVAPPRREREWSQRLAITAVVLVAAGVWWAAQTLSVTESAGVYVQGASAGMQDAGVVGVGDELPAVPVVEAPPKQGRGGMSLDMLKKPLPGQHRPPCQKPEVEIKGGCWIRLGEVPPPCGGRYYEWNKECYLPVFAPPQPPPTSGEP